MSTTAARPNDRWLKMDQIEEYTGYSDRTIRRAIQARELAASRRGGTGHIRIRESELNRWLKSNETRVRRLA